MKKGRHTDADQRLRQNNRVARVVRLLSLIQSRGRWTAGSLATEMECAQRTIYRDLNVLELAGVPWFYCRTEKCYRVRSDYYFPAIALTEDEAVGQAVATSIANAPGLDIGLGGKPTTQRLQQRSPESISRLIEDATTLIEVLDLKLADHSQQKEIIRSIQRGVLSSKRLIATYVGASDSKLKKFNLHPYRLCLVQQAWYVIGRRDTETRVKTFRVSRFRSVQVSETDANRPPDFDIREFFGNAWAVYRGEQDYDIKLRFSADVAPFVLETKWHRTQQEQRDKGGELTLSFRVAGLDEILGWILTWTGHVEILEPVKLQKMYRERLETGLEKNPKKASPR
jgi:predicted DNA-binding transcriptional regulator YafY